MTGFDLEDVPTETLLGVGTALAGVENQIDVVLALRESRAVRLAALGGRAALRVEFAHNAGWGLISADRFAFGRDRPIGASDLEPYPFVELLADLTTRAGAIVSDKAERSTSAANRLVQSLIADDRQSFRKLAEFAPIIEPAVYAIVGHAICALDELRPTVHRAFAGETGDGDRLALVYHWLTTVLERATLLSTDAGSVWLAGLAESFTWVQWTPSFALTRERSLWSALIGARAASRFGPSVIDHYFEALDRAGHPIMALDAIIGLVAIGLRHSGERDRLIARLGRASNGLSQRGLLDTGAVLQGLQLARRLLTSSGKPSPLRFVGWRRDATEPDDSGQLRAFALMPAAVEEPIWKFIPAANELRLSPSRLARSMFVRAWGPGGTRSRPEIWNVAGHA